MTKVLKEAIDEVTSLPEADQVTIGRHMLSHIEKLRRLRVELDQGVRELDAGMGKELDMEAVIRHAHTAYGKG
jgi:hypothetical protein